MNRIRTAAATVFAMLMLCAGSIGRTSGNPTRRSLADNASERALPESASSREVALRKVAPDAARKIPRTASRTWIGKDGSRKRWGPFVENDTTFLFVHEYPLGSDTNRYKVFIRKGPQPDSSPDFTDLSPRNGTTWKDFTYWLHKVKKRHPEPLPRHAALKGVPHGWTPVRSLQGDYYVDGLNPYPVWVSDSLFIRQTTDGPVPALIESAERIGPAHYRLRTKALYDGFERVDIYLVDTVRTIAVFTFANDEKGTRYRALYAPFETGLGMDRVDYYSLELPEDEVEWDDIDFDALISGAERNPETDQKQNKTNKE